MMRRQTSWAMLALLAVCTLPAAAATPLPRVFFAPQERAAITAMRRAGPQSNFTVAVAAASESTPATAAKSPYAAKLEGISLARTGGNFAWIDGKRYADGASFGAWKLRISSHGVALMRNGQVERQLRVGEPVGKDASTRAAP